jgi:hypothetical protein
MKMNEAETIPITPMLAKMQSVKTQSQAIGEFIEWLATRYTICERHEHDENDCRGVSGYRICGFREGEFFPATIQIERLLAEFFEINLDEADREKRAILEALQSRA